MPGSAQTNVVQTFRGEVQSDSAVDYREYRVELETVGAHGDVYRADVNLAGAFEFRGVPSGQYQLRVTTLLGENVQQEYVTVNATSAMLYVNLAPLRGKRPSAPGTISMMQLRHPPDRKAIQSFAAARRFAESGSPEKAAQELEKAVHISPEFADAHTNLAVQYLRLERYQEAADEMARAIQIAGPNPLRLCNLAYAQIFLGRKEEAQATARAALRLDGGYPQAHLILGTILAGDKRTVAEAIPHLQRAAESIPSAQGTLNRAREALRNVTAAQSRTN
jgi:tetratricopeptide (TPR) repeat protein